ncbi:helix-turn-helix domain-containing protein [Sphingobacterium thalpophilum]|uniref:Helix-turn-helix domain-containing protein n=1 Tax=Sphingobacterium thalpophilum TaxID=259 RepID=A0ABV4H9Y7_9SPHI|nr:helix-turn-helix domain-containing protein [Sphingobacterium thalpophilum]
MNRPIKFNLGGLGVYTTKNFLPENVTYTIPFAEYQHHEFENASMVLQWYRNYLFCIELIEFNTETQRTINYEVLEASLFIFFMLDGETIFRTLDGNILNRPVSGAYYATFNDANVYEAIFEPGKNILLYISLRKEWILREKSSLPKLSKFVSSSLKNGNSVLYMEKLFMSHSLAKSLVRIWHLPLLRGTDLESHLLPMIKEILKIYDKAQDYRIHLSGMSNEEKVHEIRAYLKSGYLLPNITNINALCKRYYITERTLRRVFYKAEKRTIIEFVVDLRLDYAGTLLYQKGLSVKQISELCGFTSSNYFCRLFKKKYGITPKDYRTITSGM